RRETDAVLADLQALARTEKRDAAPTVKQVRDRQSQAQALVAAGRFDSALALDRQGTLIAVRALNALAGDLVSRYGRVAEQATAAGQLEIAQQALNRARKVDALRRPEPSSDAAAAVEQK
ncbi:MAG TPA: hypothetical protein VH328_11125, partial [Burkholderiaceae bacterium]|nr:hypothetical protein [Burkholderiaceae bacterium]